MTLPAVTAPDPLLLVDADAIRSPWRMALRRFRRNLLAVVGALVLAILLAACFGSLPWTMGKIAPGTANSPLRYEAHNLELSKRPPAWADHSAQPLPREFWMGTDALGTDIRPRFLLGGAISLSIGICSALVAAFIGTTVGLIAGYAGGRTDALLMRLVDVLYGLPYILLVILMRVALVSVVEDILQHKDAQGKAQWLSGDVATQWANFLVLLVGIGAVSWLTLARVVRGQVLSLRQQPFVEAARALGFSSPRILGRHILPNLVGTIVVYATLTVPAAVLSESFLSFLGLGIAPPLPSWGNMAADGMEALNPVLVRWWLILWPCAGLSLALLALNFVGDGLRDAIDPKG